KGLEFDTVLLWKFGSDIHTKDVWKVILAESNQDIHQAKIKHEINLLYVAITRAQKDLLIYDGKDPSLIWRSGPIRDKVYTTDDMNYIGDIWNVISTPEEWLEQGHYFFERDYYKAAMECYKNAGEDDLVVKARAYGAEKRQDFKVAAASFERIGELEKAAFYHEKNENYYHAFQLWKKLKNKENAFRCHLKVLEKEGRFSELADIHLSRKAYQEAFEFLVKAERYDKAAQVSLKQFNDKAQAALYYEKAGLHKQSAALYHKLKDFEKAAALYEKAKDYDSARKLWKRLKREDRLIAIYHRTEDYANLLKIYEKARDFNNAVKILKKLEDSADLLTQAQDYYEKRKYFSALIRFFVMNDYSGIAKSYLKLKNFSEGGRFYALANDHYNAAKAYQKSKDFKAALVHYLKSEEDEQKNFMGARRAARYVTYGDIHEIGQKYLRRQEYKSAEFCFSFGYNYVWAGICALQSGQQEKALQHWEKCLQDHRQLEEMAGYCLSRSQIEFGARFILSHPPYAFSSFYYDFEYQFKNDSPLLLLMDQYFERHPDEEELLKWAHILGSLGSSEYLDDRRLLYLEKSRRYNEYFSYLRDLVYYDQEYMAQLRRKFKREYKELVKETSEIAAIKLYFLGKSEDFNRIVGQLEVTENNYQIFAESDHNERALDMLMQKGDLYTVKRILVNREEFMRLAEIFEQFGFSDDAAHYYGLAGEYEKSATMFEEISKFSRAGAAYYKADDYPKALEMYIKSGKNRQKIGQIYEKLGDYAKAAEIWKDLGKTRKYQKCMEKLNSLKLF
ncbi:MAG: 3'-5' exonuclease, partial [bacterium]